MARGRARASGGVPLPEYSSFVFFLGWPEKRVTSAAGNWAEDRLLHCYICIYMLVSFSYLFTYIHFGFIVICFIYMYILHIFDYLYTLASYLDVYIHKNIYIYIIYTPRTQMTLVLIGQGLVLEGWPSKIEVSWVLGIYIYIYLGSTYGSRSSLKCWNASHPKWKGFAFKPPLRSGKL